MKRYTWIAALLMLATPVGAEEDMETVQLEEPIVIGSNETFDGSGKRFVSCDQPAFRMEGTGALLENVKIEQCAQAEVPAVEVTGLGHQLIDVNVRGAGINVVNSYGVRLIRPLIIGNGRAEGISLIDSEASIVIGAIIHHARDGIYVENGSMHQMTRPLVTESRYGIHLMFPKDTVITSPNLHGNGAGAMIMGTERVRIENGQIHDQTGASATGIMLFEALETTVRANAIFGNRVGLYAEKSDWTLIYDNGINGNDVGLRFKRANEMTMEGNDLTGNRYPVLSFESAHNDVKGNEWGGQTLDVTGDGLSDLPFRSDPYLFLLADTYEAFELLYGSPGLAVLEHVLRSPDDVVLTDVGPRVETRRVSWSGSVGAAVMSSLMILLWVFGRKR